ncbi:armadillo-type protein [Mycena vulgaris]|nr:armadillo-type protein [Mycena vulgaris]KAJ6545905.1 armadillo-type protein [Mycena vulgaris]
MVNAQVLDCTAELLDSPNTDIRRWTCRLLRQLAGHRITVAAVLAIKPCEQLVACLQDQNLRVVKSAAEALHWIAAVPEGAQTALDKHVLQQAMKLFKSPEPGVRRWACGVVGQLSFHENTSAAVLGINPCQQLVSLLSDAKLVVIEGAIAALHEISRLPEGVQAAVDANVLDCVAKLLESPSIQVRRWTCKMIAELAQTLAAVVLELEPCKKLVSLLRDEDLGIVESALYALSLLTNLPEGRQNAVDANLFGSIVKLLAPSSSSHVQIRTCMMLGQLASQETTPVAALRVACKRLVPILWHTELDVRVGAVSALARISEIPDGIAVIANTVVWAHILDMTKVPDLETQVQSRIIVKNLRQYNLEGFHSNSIHPSHSRNRED